MSLMSLLKIQTTSTARVNVTWWPDLYMYRVKFYGNVGNECRNNRVKFGGAARRRFYAPPPSNSTPELRSDMQQVAFESSSKISKKILRSFLRSGQRLGHQRSSKSKWSRFSTITTILNFRRSSSWTRRARAARKKANDSPFTALPGMCRHIWPQVNGLTSRGHEM